MFLLFFSFWGSFRVVQWFLPIPPPSFGLVFYGGGAIIFFSLIWPWLFSIFGISARTRDGRELSFGDRLIVTFLVLPLLIPSWLLTIDMAFPSLSHFLWYQQVFVLFGGGLALGLYLLTPPRDPDFIKKVTFWNFIIALVVGLCIPYLSQYTSGAVYYKIVKEKGKGTYFEPYPGPKLNPGDRVWIKVYTGHIWTPQGKFSIGGDPSVLNTFPGLQEPRPQGELLVTYTNSKIAFPIGQQRGGEFQTNQEGSLEFTFNLDSQSLKNAGTETAIWIAVYVNYHLTPVGRVDFAIRDKLPVLAFLAFIAIAIAAIGMFLSEREIGKRKIPLPGKYLGPSGRKIAAGIVFTAFLVVGWNIWKTYDRHLKARAEFTAFQTLPASPNGNVPFHPPYPDKETRAIKETSFDNAERSLNLAWPVLSVLIVVLGAAIVAIGVDKALFKK